jgi:hypothetical protein
MTITEYINHLSEKLYLEQKRAQAAEYRANVAEAELAAVTVAYQRLTDHYTDTIFNREAPEAK